MNRRLLLTVMLLSIVPLSMAAPVITDIHDSVRARSARVAITGSGFGTTGTVYIDGLPCWTSLWTDTRIVAYVPEEAALGTTTLYVDSGGQQSNQVPIDVIARQRDGRVKWRFETDGDNLWFRPAVAPDGTVYIHTTNDYDGLVYALTPDGALKWIQKVIAYPGVPPSAGPEGEVYVGSLWNVYRISPQGVIDWVITSPDNANIEVAPTVGPDGRVYGAFEISGAFALDAQTGAAEWFNPGDPMMHAQSSDPIEAVFGPAGPGQPVDQFYTSMDRGAPMYAFSLDGNQLFTSVFGGIQGGTQVVIGSDGTIYGPTTIGSTISAADPTDGSVIWEYFPQDWATGTDNISIGPDDTLYFVGSSAKLEAFDTSTQERIWQYYDTNWCLDWPTVTPDGSKLILDGSRCKETGTAGFVKAFDAATGTPLWDVALPFDLGPPSYRINGTHHPRITDDGQTAYVSTYSLIEWPLEQDHAFVYAIDISETGCATPEVGGVRHDANKTTIRWTALPEGTLYDIARGDLDALGGGPSPTCMQQGMPQNWHDDASMPSTGFGYYYIVRSSDTCGVSSWGQDSGGQERVATCP